MGFAIPQIELEYISNNIGKNWDRIWADPLVFARFIEFAEQEASVDRNKFLQRLRVAFARNETPSTFMVLLMQRFYEEGADAGIRKFLAAGVTFYCPPNKLTELQAAASKYPGYQHIIKWELPSNRPMRMGVYCYFLDPKHADSRAKGGRIKPAIWEKEEWPHQIKIGGELLSVFFRLANSEDSYERAPYSEEESRIEIYRYAHDLLGECFGMLSPAAYSQEIDATTLHCMSGSTDDVLANLTGLFRLHRVARDRFPNILANKIDGVKKEAATRYSHIRSRLFRDADYQYRETMPLMDQGVLRTYLLAPFEIERAMKPIVENNLVEIRQVISRAEGDNFYWNNKLDPEKTACDEGSPILSNDALQQYLECHEDRFYAKTAFHVITEEISRHAKPLDEIKTLPSKQLTPRIVSALKGQYNGDPASGFYLSWPLILGLAQKFSIALDGDNSVHREGSYGSLVVYSKLAPYCGLEFDGKLPGDSTEYTKAFNAFARVTSIQKTKRKARL